MPNYNPRDPKWQWWQLDDDDTDGKGNLTQKPLPDCHTAGRLPTEREIRETERCVGVIIERANSQGHTVDPRDLSHEAASTLQAIYGRDWLNHLPTTTYDGWLDDAAKQNRGW